MRKQKGMTPMNLFIPINSFANELIFWERYEDTFFFGKGEFFSRYLDYDQVKTDITL